MKLWLNLDNQDFLNLEKDDDLNMLVARMDDGLAESWITVTTSTIGRYVTTQLLSELEDIQRIIAKRDNSTDVTKLLNDRILRLVERIK